MKKVLLTGGGTLGSVVPLIALAEELGERCQYFWLGTMDGPEKAVVVEAGLSFRGIHSGKLRRYWHWRNLVDPFLSLAGFIQAYVFCLKWRPELVVSAGSFVAVPVVWAAKMSGAKVLLYQLDVRPGLANKLCLSASDKVAVVWPEAKAAFGDKALWCSAIVRRSLHDQSSLFDSNIFKTQFGLRADLPLLLVTGGGTGASGLNHLLYETLPFLVGHCVVLHTVGKGRGLSGQPNNADYHAIEALPQSLMSQALAASRLVLSRAGMGALSELAYNAKPVILVPLPGTHQEENARLAQTVQAAVIIKQESEPQKLAAEITRLLRQSDEAQAMGGRLKKLLTDNGASSLLRIALDLLHVNL